MNLTDIKRIAAVRSKGEWVSQTYGIYGVEGWRIYSTKILNSNGLPTAIECRSADKANIEFITMAANNIDQLIERIEKLEEVADRAHELIFSIPNLSEWFLAERLVKSLAALNDYEALKALEEK